jgi:hypothetical protein
VERLQHIVGWFDHWLLGVAKPEYAVAPEVSMKPDAVPGKAGTTSEPTPR